MQLPIVPATYYAATGRPASARQVSDREPRPDILEVWEDNLCVCGADKVSDQLNNDGITMPRCSVERLMVDMGVGVAAHGYGPRSVTTNSSGRPTSSDAASRPRHRTSCGSLI